LNPRFPRERSQAAAFLRFSNAEPMHPDLAGHETRGKTMHRKLRSARHLEQNRGVEAAQEANSR
jgi:hypothetical protein